MSTGAILTRVRGMGRSAFLAAHPRPFLIVTIRVDPDTGDGSGFNTVVRGPDARAGRSSSRVEVFELKKSEGNPYSDRISLGRARNCDLVVRDSSISKLHAHFRPKEGEGWELVDLDSQNGTFLNGKRLTPNEPAAVQHGDQLLFGVVAVKLVDAATLYDHFK
jgi:hypothetical protein